MSALVAPHGGRLSELMVTPARAAELRAASRDWPSWDLTPRQLCDLELLLDGGFSPLTGYLTRPAYERVVAAMRLPAGLLWPIPITLDVSEAFAERVAGGGAAVALRDPEGAMLAVLDVEDVWRPDREAEAQAVYGTTDRLHPGVAQLLERSGPVYLGGRVEGIELPRHYDFVSLRATPAQLRADFARLGWSRVVAFQTRNPLHRAHYELAVRAARETGARLLIHPVVGATKPGDVDHYTRVRCYQAVLERCPPGLARLALLPLAMRLAGPREAVWHAIIRKNFGCTHFIVGRDHAGPGTDARGCPFYGPYDAQELLRRHAAELGIVPVPFQRMVYLRERDAYVPEDELPAGAQPLDLSGTELRRRLATGTAIPPWFTFPEVASELRRRHPARRRQGVTVFFTGLSGAGKSTIANIVHVKLLERGGRTVTVLDGDLVRKYLSSELGFSKEHRDLNIRRIGFVAAEVARHGGVVLCAAIAPYEAARRQVREMIEPHGGFVLVHVATPLDVCEQRDRKGLYAKARAGLVAGFTGISDPYEPPTDADLVLDTVALPAEEAADRVLAHLEAEGYLAAPPQARPARRPRAGAGAGVPA
jgi:sulfate adenylyltransferase